MTKQITISIISFFLLAFILTYACSKLPTIIILTVDVKDMLCGFGPLLSGIICYIIFRTPTKFSIGGTQPLKALLIVFITVITFMITSTKHSFWFNIIYILSQLIYCFGEEFGWRHYLQSTTNKLNKWLQSFIIGLVWFCWHFSWLKDPIKAMTGQNMHAPVAAVIIFTIIALSIVSFLLGLVINKTKSILLPTVLHFAVKTNMPTIIIAFTFTTVAMLTWKKLITKKI